MGKPYRDLWYEVTSFANLLRGRGLVVSSTCAPLPEQRQPRLLGSPSQ
jgi:hypothetical protein